ncbi:MAG: helix-turn-helix transcriptional regulator [Burkholderiaceae bacterium]
MSFIPSHRECLHGLDRMRDTPQIVADLELLNAELWGADGGAHELTAAIARLRELHQLCLHMAANMAGGLGVPPTPPAAPLRKQTGSGNTAPARASTPHWQRTPEPGATAVIPTYNAVQAAKVLGVSLSYFYAMCRDGKVPVPTSGGGCGIKAAWPAGAIDAIARQRAAAPSKFGARGRAPAAAADGAARPQP